MKSYIKGTVVPQENLTYPCLMTAKEGAEQDMVVLFTEPSVGTVVVAAPGATFHCLGYHTKTWSAESFKPFTGTVVMEG